MKRVVEKSLRFFGNQLVDGFPSSSMVMLMIHSVSLKIKNL